MTYSPLHVCIILSTLLHVSALGTGCNIEDSLANKSSGAVPDGMDMMRATVDMSPKPDAGPDAAMVDQPEDMLSVDCLADALFAAGDGSVTNPFVICNAEQFVRILDAPGRAYQLAADIDLKDITWSPIEVFTGSLDGRGFAVQNLAVRGDESFGGFSKVFTGSMKDIRFEDLDVVGIGSNVGGITYLAQGASFQGVTLTGEVEGLNYVGGLAARISVSGQNVGMYESIRVTATITVTGQELDNAANIPQGHAGIFAGLAGPGVTLHRIHVQGAVRGLAGPPFGPWKVGGVVGVLTSSTLEECMADVVLDTPYGTRIGGLVGTSTTSTIRHCGVQGESVARAGQGGVLGEVIQNTRLEYVWSSMAMMSNDANFPPQGCVGLDGELAEGAHVYYADDVITADTLPFSAGYSGEELRDAQTFVDWPSPPWIIKNGTLPTLSSEQ